MRKNFGAKEMCYPMPVFIIGTYNEDGTYSYFFVFEMDDVGSARTFKVTAK